MVEPSCTHADVSWLSSQLEGGSLETSDLEEEESVLFLGHLLVDMARLAREAARSEEHDRLEPGLATAESASLQAQCTPLDSEVSHDPWQALLSLCEIDDPWLVERAPTSPPRLKQRRWGGGPTSGLEDLPEELYSLIVPHVECSGLAPLALVSTSWSAACREHFVSGEFWERRIQVQKEAMKDTRSGLVDHEHFMEYLRVWSEGALRLLGALACRCSGPTELVQLLRAAQQSDRPVVGWESNFVEGLVWQCGPQTLGPQLVKCGRLEEWTKERVLEVMCLYVDEDEFNDATQSLDAACHLAEAATALIGSMRTGSTLSRGFSVSLHEVFALFLARFVKERETRSRMVMAQFAVFVEGFVFGDDEAAEIGRFAASAHLPIDDIIDLITKLGDEEGRAYHRGFVASRGRDATCATLSSWATASNFPAAWAEADVLALTQALRTLAVAWGEEFLEAVNPTLTWLEAVIGGGVPSMAGHCEKAPLQEVAVSQ